jgi:ribonuclease P protein component
MDSAKECPQNTGETFYQEEELAAVISLPFLTKSLAKKDFALLKTRGIRIYGKSIKFSYSFGSFEGIELGVTAFKKGGNAVARNYFRRLVKEVFRKTKPLLPKGLKLQILPLSTLDKISYRTILVDFHESLCTQILSKKELLKQ